MNNKHVITRTNLTIRRSTVDKILDKIPEKKWRDPNYRIVDRSCGGAQLVREIENRIREYGGNPENRVFGLFENELIRETVTYMYGLKGSYRKSKKEIDALNIECTISNPPFDKNADEKHIIHALNNTKRDVCMFMSSSWIYANNSHFRNFLFSSGNLVSIEWIQSPNDKENERAFVQSGFGICLVTLSKQKRDSFTVIDRYGQKRAVLSSEESRICIDNINSYLLAEKLSHNKSLEYRHCTGRPSTEAVDAANPGNFKVLRTITKGYRSIEWIPGLGKDNGDGLEYKVGLNKNGGVRKFNKLTIEGPDVYACQSSLFLCTKSNQQAANLIVYLKTKFVTFLAQSAKTNKKNTRYVFSRIPDIDLSKSWTDKELYIHFNLTSEEIKNIESL